MSDSKTDPKDQEAEQDNGEAANNGTEQLYATMGIPEGCLLGKRIFKKLFHENSQLGTTDKKAFKDDIDKVIWMFKLEPNSVSIPAFNNEEREYLEVAVLQVDCKTQKRTGRIAQIIHRAIPYPLMIVFSYDSSILISLAHKRFSQSEKGAIVADDFHNSPWFDLTSPSALQSSFLASLKIASLPNTNLYAFYSGLVERMTALDCARLSGSYSIESNNRQVDRKKILQQCRELETQIAELRKELKGEEQFNRTFDLGIKIKELEKQLKQSADQLK